MSPMGYSSAVSMPIARCKHMKIAVSVANRYVKSFIVISVVLECFGTQWNHPQ